MFYKRFFTVKTPDFFSKWRKSMKYYFLLIAILEVDLRYNNNINIVYNDTADVVTNRRWFTYIEKEIMAEDLIQILRPRQDYVMSNNDNDWELADTIYIIRWGVDGPTLCYI